MATHTVQLYIYELTEDSQIWCRNQYLEILPNEENIIHTSIVVHGTEYTYGENGIEEQEPKLRPYYDDNNFTEAVTMISILGKTKLSKEEVAEEISKLKKDNTWFSYKFNPIDHNCHHFSEILAKILCGDNTNLPAEVLEFNKNLLSYRNSWIEEFTQF